MSDREYPVLIGEKRTVSVQVHTGTMSLVRSFASLNHMKVWMAFSYLLSEGLRAATDRELWDTAKLVLPSDGIAWVDNEHQLWNEFLRERKCMISVAMAQVK